MPNKVTAEELKNIWQAQNLEQSQIEVLAELEAIKAENEAIKQELEDVNVKLSETLAVQLTGSIVGYSTDEKPIIGVQKGNDFFELDTGDAYIYDGDKWVMI